VSVTIKVPKQADLMVGTWAWRVCPPARIPLALTTEPGIIKHVRTYVPGKLPNGKDDVRHDVVFDREYWEVTSVCHREHLNSAADAEGNLVLDLDRATEGQQAAFESAYALLPLANTLGQFLSGVGSTIGAGPVLTDDILEAATKLENALRAALRRRS